MKTTEYRNMKAKCIDRNNPSDVVMHEVSYDNKETDGNWTNLVVNIMATDPMGAIKKVSNSLLLGLK